MSFNFQFRFAQDRKELQQLEKHLLNQPFDYPNYPDWVKRAVEEISLGYKMAILAFSEDVLVGDLILQPHKVFDGVLEFKNMRVNPKLQKRYFGAFMLRQGEVEADKNNYSAIICDTHSDNLPVINMLKQQGYRVIARAPLYDENVEEVVFGKYFGEDSSGLFVPIRKAIITVVA